jgi:hypothetical protein
VQVPYNTIPLLSSGALFSANESEKTIELAPDSNVYASAQLALTQDYTDLANPVGVYLSYDS